MEIDLRFVVKEEVVSPSLRRTAKVLQWRRGVRVGNIGHSDIQWEAWQDVPLVKETEGAL
jgi:hypothetical protein